MRTFSGFRPGNTFTDLQNHLKPLIHKALPAPGTLLDIYLGTQPGDPSHRAPLFFSKESIHGYTSVYVHH
ncbi:hypothetical protein, partial [Pseudomonas sp. RW409]|uniref:hypothetical protein n=1 Tax=Pseudomonas sp. RW409 TaxID=2202895 RepID=UPI001C481847